MVASAGWRRFETRPATRSAWSSLVRAEPTRMPSMIMSADGGLVISLMLAVPDASQAASWYAHALGARQLWSLGSVVGLEVEGAPLFLAEPANNGCPTEIGTTTLRVEVFVDDPDAFVARAVAAGARGRTDPVRDHKAPWRIHRQGSFVDPFGHIWLVGDKSPLRRFPL